MKSFSISDAISFGWAKTKQHFWTVAPLILATVFIRIVSSVLAGGSHHGAMMSYRGEFSGNPIGSLLSFLVSIYGLIVSANVIKAFFNVVDGNKVEFWDIFTPKDYTLQYLITVIFYGVIVAIGTILLIIPGIIFAIMFSFGYFLVIDKKLDATAALRRSKAITDGQKFELFGFGIAIVVLNIVGALFLGVGLFITIPITCFASIQVYRLLNSKTPETVAAVAASVPPTPPTPSDSSSQTPPVQA